jgi:hypothetical protein
VRIVISEITVSDLYGQTFESRDCHICGLCDLLCSSFAHCAVSSFVFRIRKFNSVNMVESYVTAECNCETNVHLPVEKLDTAVTKNLEGVMGQQLELYQVG